MLKVELNTSVLLSLTHWYYSALLQWESCLESEPPRKVISSSSLHEHIPTESSPPL